MTESERKAIFRDCPILADYLATALQDLQYSESDEACSEGREPRDSGTIYDCSDSVFEWARTYCVRFMADCAEHISAAINAHPGDDGFEYVRNPASLTYDGIGSTLYLASVGHGVTFTDDGSASCLEAMSEWVEANYREGLCFGDDGEVYAI